MSGWRWILNGTGGVSSGEYEYRPKKRGGVYLWHKGAIIFDAPSAKIAKMYAVRHSQGLTERPEACNTLKP